MGGWMSEDDIAKYDAYIEEEKKLNEEILWRLILDITCTILEVIIIQNINLLLEYQDLFYI